MIDIWKLGHPCTFCAYRLVALPTSARFRASESRFYLYRNIAFAELHLMTESIVHFLYIYHSLSQRCY